MKIEPAAVKAIPSIGGSGHKTIKIVRLNPSGSLSQHQGNVQILPKPAILSSTKMASSQSSSSSSSVVSIAAGRSNSNQQQIAQPLSDNRNAMIQKQLNDLKEAREALRKQEQEMRDQEEELMRQLGGGETTT